MRVSDQIRPLKAKFEVSIHSFFNRVAQGVSQRFSIVAPGLSPKLQGRRNIRYRIKAELKAEVNIVDPAERDEMQRNVRIEMDRLRNQSAFTALWS